MPDAQNEIDWTTPQPREGWLGSLDRFIGPDTTRAELALELGASLGAALMLVAYAVLKPLDWNVLQILVAALLALDLFGGVVTNATASAKRWYHRVGQGFRDHLTFIAIHLIHPLLIAGLFRDGDWLYAVVIYGYLMAVAVLILRVPLYLQRPVALLALCGGFLLNAYIVPPVAGLEWFVPVFYLKLLVAHALREAPFKAK